MAKHFFVSCGLAFALAFAPLCASAQQQRTPERQALLERLGATLPPSDLTAQDVADGMRPSFAEIERNMHSRNPGREAEITALLDGYALCIGTATTDAALGLALDAADIALNDAEIEQLITFYSGPDYTRFADINTRFNRREQLAPEDSAFMMSYIQHPAVSRFALQTVRTSQEFAASTAGQQIVTTCGEAFIAAYRGAGLQSL